MDNRVRVQCVYNKRAKLQPSVGGFMFRRHSVSKDGTKIRFKCSGYNKYKCNACVTTDEKVEFYVGELPTAAQHSCAMIGEGKLAAQNAMATAKLEVIRTGARPSVVLANVLKDIDPAVRLQMPKVDSAKRSLRNAKHTYGTQPLPSDLLEVNNGEFRTIMTDNIASAAPTTSRPVQQKPKQTQQKKIKNPLLWIDLEMSGLDVDKERIMELACLLTDGELEQVVEGPEVIIHQPDTLLDNMNEWCTRQHGKTGLTDSCRRSKITELEAENSVLAFLAEHGIESGQARLAGNTVYMDRLFLRRYMPRLDSYLHYRIVDVSTVKELCRYWYQDEFYKAPSKEGNHRAMQDIYASLEELRYYRSSIFKQPL